MRYVFLLNPAAGRQDSTKELEAAARAALARAGVPAGQWSIRRTAYKGHARELARAAAAAGGPVTLFAAGGDGTFNEVLTGAKGCPGAAVGCIPAGSGNDFLRTFGTKADFLDLDAQLAGRPVTIDLMDTTLGLSAAVCAAGLDAQVANGAAAYRHNPLFHGEAAYLLSALRQICGPLGRRFRFEADGEVLEEDVLMCAVCNTRDYGGGFRAAPLARPDDGWLDLVVVRKVGRLKILRLLGHAVKTVQQIDKHQDHNACPEDSQLFTDHRENHVIVGLRDASQLLDAVSQPLSEQSAGAYGIQCLQRLIGLVRVFFRVRIQPRLNSSDTEG